MNNKTKQLTLLSFFVALELMLGLVPNLGFITTGGMQITTLHIPVILCAVLMGAKEGAVVGFFFGLVSFLNATFLTPHPIISPLFTPFFSSAAFAGSWLSLVICFVPRILVGVFAGLSFKALSKTMKNVSMPLILSGIIGTVTNTVLVLVGVYTFFGQQYATAAGIRIIDILAGIVGINGLLEAVLAGVLCLAVGKASLYAMKKG